MSENKDFKEKAKSIMNDVKESTEAFDAKDVESGKGMGVLSYIIPLIPFFVEKKNKFVMYHAKQGMNLFIVTIAYSIVYGILTSIIKVRGSCGSLWGYTLGNYCRVTPWWITLPLGLIGLCISVIAIMGIINVLHGKAKELPIINKVKIFK